METIQVIKGHLCIIFSFFFSICLVSGGPNDWSIHENFLSGKSLFQPIELVIDWLSSHDLIVIFYTFWPPTVSNRYWLTPNHA